MCPDIGCDEWWIGEGRMSGWLVPGVSNGWVSQLGR